MCDYSLQAVKSRAAEVGDELITHSFGTGTTGFASINDKKTAICLLPGTEVVFEKPVCSNFAHVNDKPFGREARFRQINKEHIDTHHDALEFPDGNVVLLTALEIRQRARVLQLPAAPRTKAEAKEQTRLEVVG
jgi:hypothetical protein